MIIIDSSLLHDTAFLSDHERAAVFDMYAFQLESHTRVVVFLILYLFDTEIYCYILQLDSIHLLGHSAIHNEKPYKKLQEARISYNYDHIHLIRPTGLIYIHI